MMSLSYLVVLVLVLVSLSYSYRMNGKILRCSTQRYLFGNTPEPPKTNNAPAKKDGGLFGGMGNIMDSMKKAQEIAKQAEVVNKELMDTIIVGNDPSGQVTATFNGLGMPIGIKLSDAVLNSGSEAASLAATQAMVDAHAKAQNAMMSKVILLILLTILLLTLLILLLDASIIQWRTNKINI